MIIPADRIRAGGSSYVDTASREELRVTKRLPAPSEREQMAMRVYRRRIESLQEENRRLMASLAQSAAAEDGRVEAASAQALEEGRQQGREETLAQLREQFSLIALMQTEFRRAAGEYHRDADSELVRLVRWMCERVLARTLPLEEDLLARQVRALVEHWAGEDVYRFRLHPQDRQLLSQDPGLEDLRNSLQGRIEWVSSPEIPRGSCRLELAHGVVDSLPEEMLNHLEEVLLAAIDGRPDPEDEA